MDRSPVLRAPTDLDPEAGPGEPGPPVPGGEPVLWIVDAARHAAAADRLAPTVLDHGERRRAAAFRRESDRVLYVTAHVALRVLLGSYLALDPGRVRLTRERCPVCAGPHGRPAVEGGAPHFSLSHSGGLALLAFAAEPVGADIEEIPAAETAGEVGAALHPRERAELRALPDGDRPAACARAWARKESYLKGIGTGLARDIALDYLGTAPGGAARLAGWRVDDVAVPEGFAAAVAVAVTAAEPGRGGR